MSAKLSFTEEDMLVIETQGGWVGDKVMPKYPQLDALARNLEELISSDL